MSKTISFTEYEIELLQAMLWNEEQRTEYPERFTQKDINKYECAMDSLNKKIYKTS